MQKPSSIAEIPRKILTEEEIDQIELSLTSKSLESEALAHFSPVQLKIIKKIVYYTSQIGLSIEEACTLANFSFEELKNIMQKDPLVEKIITMKELEFKKDMLHTVTVRARNGDDRLALWLLERKYPSEFANQKIKPSDNQEKNFLFQAIEFIQRNGDASPLVAKENASAVVIRKGMIQTVEDILV